MELREKAKQREESHLCTYQSAFSERLSIFKVLYKIPSWILGKRLALTLSIIIGGHQYGFVADKGIQDPTVYFSCYTPHSRFTSNWLLSLTDRIWYWESLWWNSCVIIIQVLWAFGFPELLIQALHFYVLITYAKEEVNGQKGICITTKTVPGQGTLCQMSSASLILNHWTVSLRQAPWSHVYYQWESDSGAHTFGWWLL